MKKNLNVLFFLWGWITPGTGRANLREQGNDFSDYLKQKPNSRTAKQLVTNCGWWFDKTLSKKLQDLTRLNPENNRNICSRDNNLISLMRQCIEKKRIEFVVYPYAAMVSDAVSGESLLRSFRASREIALKQFNIQPDIMINHDGPYDLDWGCPQLPQIAHMLGFKFIIGSENAKVVTENGCEIRMFGRQELQEYFSKLRPMPAGYVFSSHELHEGIKYHQNFQSISKSDPIYDHLNFKSVNLAEYLKYHKSVQKLSAEEIGTKSWFGGMMDTLVMEQYLHSTELCLPGIEAIANIKPLGIEALEKTILDLWKNIWILLDNHIMWQMHDYKKHYLPKAKELFDSIGKISHDLLSDKKAKQEALYNPVAWEQDLLYLVGGKTHFIEKVPGWSIVPLQSEPLKLNVVQKNILSLSNDNTQVTFNKNGEISKLIERGRIVSKNTGFLKAVAEQAINDRGKKLEIGAQVEFEGSFKLSHKVKLKSLSKNAKLQVNGIRSWIYLIECHRFDINGKCVGKQVLRSHNLHWGKAGMPRHSMDLKDINLSLEKAVSIEIILWGVAEGKVSIKSSSIKLDHKSSQKLDGWKLQKSYKHALVSPSKVRVVEHKKNDHLDILKFEGEINGISYQQTWSLRKNSSTIECGVDFKFRQKTHCGISTPPLKLNQGSLLGGLCERPYIPGLMIIFPVENGSSYESDRPFSIEKVFRKKKRTWHTDKENWWNGFSPFTGLNLAMVSKRAKSMALLGKGNKHFFRLQRFGKEYLGYSFGTTVPHAMTQGYSISKDSPYYDILGRVNHDPYQSTEFLKAKGQYSFDFSLTFSSTREENKINLWKKSKSLALYTQSIKSAAGMEGISIKSKSIILSSFEKRDGYYYLRMFNLSRREAVGAVRFPFDVKIFSSKIVKDSTKNSAKVSLEAKAITEIKMRKLKG